MAMTLSARSFSTVNWPRQPRVARRDAVEAPCDCGHSHADVGHGDFGHFASGHGSLSHGEVGHGDCGDGDCGHSHSEAGHNDGSHSYRGHGDCADEDCGHDDCGHDDCGHGESSHGDVGHGDGHRNGHGPSKRPWQDEHNPEALKRPRHLQDDGSRDCGSYDTTSLDPDAIVTRCASFDEAASCLPRSDCGSSLACRTLDEETARAFETYVASAPTWTQLDHTVIDPASWDRVTVVDYGSFGTETDAGGEIDGDLDHAVAYGAGLLPRFSSNPTPARDGIDLVLSVLPAQLAAVLAADAAELLKALRERTRYEQFSVRLELVRGDTCRKWHCDWNVARTLITYCGPGTRLMNERDVRRRPDGAVESVRDEETVRARAGDLVILKGGLWEGLAGYGSAHRSPIIGPAHSCPPALHRIVLKVDILATSSLVCESRTWRLRKSNGHSE